MGDGDHAILVHNYIALSHLLFQLLVAYAHLGSSTPNRRLIH